LIDAHGLLSLADQRRRGWVDSTRCWCRRHPNFHGSFLLVAMCKKSNRYHHNGSLRRSQEKEVTHLQSKLRRRTARLYMSHVHILTVCTYDSIGLQNWKRSLAQHGYKPEQVHLLGFGAKWGGWPWRTQQYAAEIRRLEQKWQQAHEEEQARLNSQTENRALLDSSSTYSFATQAQRGQQQKPRRRNLYVLTDANDIVFVAPPEYLDQQFMSFGPDVEFVVSAERAEWLIPKHAAKWFKQQYAHKTKYVYPNHGTLCGYASQLLLFLDLNKDAPDDQVGLQEKWCSGELARHGIHPTLDYESRICGVIVSVVLVSRRLGFFDHWNFVRVDKKRKGYVDPLLAAPLIQKDTRQRPGILHFPGATPNHYNRMVVDFVVNGEPRPWSEVWDKHSGQIILWSVIALLAVLLLATFVVFVVRRSRQNRESAAVAAAVSPSSSSGHFVDVDGNPEKPGAMLIEET
jgi:hypothetical protein